MTEGSPRAVIGAPRGGGRAGRLQARDGPRASHGASGRRAAPCLQRRPLSARARARRAAEAVVACALRVRVRVRVGVRVGVGLELGFGFGFG